MFENVELINKERFLNGEPLSRTSVDSAVETAADCIRKSLERFKKSFAFPASGFFEGSVGGRSVNRYTSLEFVDWTSGMWTGVYWLLYELTGDKIFRSAAESHIEIYERTAYEAINLNDHDTGFKFSPSCVAAYKLTGNEKAKNAALRAAQIQLEHYCPYNKFIIRTGTRSCDDRYEDYRTLVDTMLNIPLFFWAYKETGEKAYYDAAVGHYNTTAKYLIRKDGSSYHHYQFDPESLAPVRGVTWQGNSDNSCWSRGQSWLVYGYPIAYRYTGDDKIPDIHRGVSYYFLNGLPDDFIAYWDFDFGNGSMEPRDSSASAVSAAGLLEMSRLLPDTSADKALYRAAAEKIIKSLISLCSNKGDDGDGIILHTTGSKPHNLWVDTIQTYGDYFYLEALMRIIKPEWNPYW